MKSISKSYGVPGLRLGILASGDIETMKKDVAIWNINSFGEFYLQIAEKYKNNYIEAMEQFRDERKRFYDEISKLPGVRVIPSQANYFMVELDENVSVRGLLKKLLISYRIFIKELSSKTNGGNYLRIAIRDTEDNYRLLDALRKELS